MASINSPLGIGSLAAMALVITRPAHSATPIPAIGANVDIIVEGYNPDGSLDTYATSSFDVVNGSTFVAKGIGFGGDPGLLYEFTSQSDPSIEFQLLGAYDEPNALQILNGSSGTLTLTVPAPYSSIYLLTASANGTGTGTATIHFAGGSTLPLPFTSRDWYNNEDVAFSGGPVYAGTNGDGNRAYYSTGQDAPAAPRLFQYELVIPEEYQDLDVASIAFAVDSAGNDRLYTSILGLSGVAVPEPSTLALGSLALLGLAVRRR